MIYNLYVVKPMLRIVRKISTGKIFNSKILKLKTIFGLTTNLQTFNSLVIKYI